MSNAAPRAVTPQLPDTSKSYWFDSWAIASIWARGITGKGMTVAVLDSGVQASDPALTGVVLPGTDLSGGDGRHDVDSPRGHGTAMTLFIAGQGGPNDMVGIAPDARILPVQVDRGEHTAGQDFAKTFSSGITYAVAHGAKIINMSVAQPDNVSPDSCPPQVASAVRDAIAKGAIVVAGAGNEGDSSNFPSYPAACKGVVAVGAVDWNKHPWASTQRQPYVDVAAMGVHMHSQNLAGTVGTSDGTSDATALVSGALALMWSQHPNLTNRQIVAHMLRTLVDDADHPGIDEWTGRGIVRPHVAVRTPVDPNAPNPIFDELDQPATSAAPGAPSTSPVAAPTTPAGSKGSLDGSKPVLYGLGALLALAALGAIVVVGVRRGPAN